MPERKQSIERRARELEPEAFSAWDAAFEDAVRQGASNYVAARLADDEVGLVCDEAMREAVRELYPGGE